MKTLSKHGVRTSLAKLAARGRLCMMVSVERATFVPEDDPDDRRRIFVSLFLLEAARKRSRIKKLERWTARYVGQFPLRGKSGQLGIALCAKVRIENKGLWAPAGLFDRPNVAYEQCPWQAAVAEDEADQPFGGFGGEVRARPVVAMIDYRLVESAPEQPLASGSGRDAICLAPDATGDEAVGLARNDLALQGGGNERADVVQPCRIASVLVLFDADADDFGVMSAKIAARISVELGGVARLLGCWAWDWIDDYYEMNQDILAFQVVDLDSASVQTNYRPLNEIVRSGWRQYLKWPRQKGGTFGLSLYLGRATRRAMGRAFGHVERAWAAQDATSPKGDES